MNVQMLSVKEAAVIFRVQPKTVRAWIAQGKLAASRIGRGYLISAEAVGKVTAQPVEGIAIPHNKGMAEFRALLRSGGKIDKQAYIADSDAELEYYRKHDHRQ